MLNEKQMEAVNTLKGQVLVVSCPGSGKTTVIVNRTKKIIDSGVPSEKILAPVDGNTYHKKEDEYGA